MAAHGKGAMLGSPEHDPNHLASLHCFGQISETVEVGLHWPSGSALWSWPPGVDACAVSAPQPVLQVDLQVSSMTTGSSLRTPSQLCPQSKAFDFPASANFPAQPVSPASTAASGAVFTSLHCFGQISE